MDPRLREGTDPGSPCPLPLSLRPRLHVPCHTGHTRKAMRAYCRSPHNACSTVSATTAAVSVLSTRGPSRTGMKPAC